MPLTNWTRGWGFTEDVVISHRRDLILSVLVRAKLVRNRRVVESLAAARWLLVFPKIVSVSIIPRLSF